jgi:hypothetical protein
LQKATVLRQLQCIALLFKSCIAFNDTNLPTLMFIYCNECSPLPQPERTNLENGSIWDDLSSSSEAMDEAAVPSSPRPEDGELEAVICASGAWPLNPSASFQCSLICSNQPQGGSLTSIEIYTVASSSPASNPLEEGENNVPLGQIYWTPSHVMVSHYHYVHGC